MIIAIDGPSGTGKSTVARGVAKKLGFTNFSSPQSLDQLGYAYRP